VTRTIVASLEDEQAAAVPDDQQASQPDETAR
jgi:hypothetical protein